MKRTGIQQELNTLAGCQLSLFVLSVDPVLTAAQEGLLAFHIDRLDHILQTCQEENTNEIGCDEIESPERNLVKFGQRSPNRECEQRWMNAQAYPRRYSVKKSHICERKIWSWQHSWWTHGRWRQRGILCVQTSLKRRTCVGRNEQREHRATFVIVKFATRGC
jgi:hypothetical protein